MTRFRRKSRALGRNGRAFTLIEMMLTLALVTLLYTIMSTILVQVASYVRVGRQIAESRLVFLREVDVLRYQLRALHYPNTTVSMLGAPGSLKGRDQIRFLTSRGRKHRGVVEVGYKIEAYQDPKDPQAGEKTGLFYREFPFRRKLMRTLDESTEGPWRMVLPDVSFLFFEYSTTGTAWQREWDGTEAPRLVRIRIRRSEPNHDNFAFEVTPGEGAARW